MAGDSTVEEAMTHLVVTLRPNDKIPDAAKRLLANQIRGAPVVDGGRVVGVISEVDLVRAYAPPARCGALSGWARAAARYSGPFKESHYGVDWSRQDSRSTSRVAWRLPGSSWGDRT